MMVTAHVSVVVQIASPMMVTAHVGVVVVATPAGLPPVLLPSSQESQILLLLHSRVTNNISQLFGGPHFHRGGGRTLIVLQEPARAISGMLVHGHRICGRRRRHHSGTRLQNHAHLVKI